MSQVPLPIRHFMSSSPYCIEQDQPMSDAHQMMREKRLRHLPVLARGQLVGVVSAGDLHLLETLHDVDPDLVRVADAMSAEPYSVRPDTPLHEVVDVMAANKYGCALVVDTGRVVGIFTTVDALESFARRLWGPGLRPPGAFDAPG
jgi:acetoin utilization protein AcuB